MKELGTKSPFFSYFEEIQWKKSAEMSGAEATSIMHKHHNNNQNIKK